ncbi:MAG: acyl-CoA thioesterase [Lachnospiraceae bacterium]|nr:acyl-CoA thioesterase [Lachnospiraceae bacterium]
METIGETKPFVWKAQYYETDQMGIVHHSNYIRWMESARIDFLEQLGASYGKMEELGIISPVLAVNCEYKTMVHFGDPVEIHAAVKEYNGVKMTVSYRMINQKTGKLCTLGESRHCFLTKEGKPVSLTRSYPEWDQVFKKALELGGLGA